MWLHALPETEPPVIPPSFPSCSHVSSCLPSHSWGGVAPFCFVCYCQVPAYVFLRNECYLYNVKKGRERMGSAHSRRCCCRCYSCRNRRCVRRIVRVERRAVLVDGSIPQVKDQRLYKIQDVTNQVFRPDHVYPAQRPPENCYMVTQLHFVPTAPNSSPAGNSTVYT